MNILNLKILVEFISLKLRQANFWSKSHFYTMYSLQKVRLTWSNKNDLVYMQVLWPMGPEVALWYLGSDCLCVYNDYRINNLKWEFVCILKWLNWCGESCDIQMDERILKYDHNHFLKFSKGSVPLRPDEKIRKFESQNFVHCLVSMCS